MTDFQYVEYEDTGGDWGWKIETRKKFPSGMTGVLAFEAVEQQADGTWCYNVYLDMRRKRKKASAHREVTGRDGLEPAGWVLQALKDFEKQDVADEHLPFRIEVFGGDSRRWKLYEKILTKRGYTVTMVDKRRTLVKRIER